MSESAIPLDLQMKFAELDQKIKAAHPTMPLLLKQIHDILKKDPEIVTLLTEEEIGIVVSGLSAQTKTVITQAALKSKKALSKTTLADL